MRWEYKKLNYFVLLFILFLKYTFYKLARQIWSNDLNTDKKIYSNELNTYVYIFFILRAKIWISLVLHQLHMIKYIVSLQYLRAQSAFIAQRGENIDFKI